MTMPRRTVKRCLLAAAGATAVTPMAWGQEPARPGGLEEIIVTAQKRVESAQDVPIALSVFDASALEESNIDRIEEIVMRTPNFTMMRVNVGEPQFYIRGVGSNSDSAAGDPTVGVFQDEIYVGRISGAAFDVFDMERVEVLRGPQGTLYGRNTSGGAVNFVPKRPGEELYAGAEFSYGNYNSLEGRLVLNGGLTETLAGRLSVSHREHSGYSENITTGADLDDEDNWSLRGQLLVSPSDATRLLLGYDYVKDDAAGNARVPFPVFDTGQVGAANNAALVALRAIWPADSDLRKAYSVPESSQERAINGLTARLEHETSIGDWTLLYGHRDVELSWYEDLDGLKPYGTPPIPAVYQPPYGWVLQNRDIADEEARQHSVELRLASPADAGLQWVAGLYYFREDVDRVERFVTQYSLAPVAGGDVTFVQEVESTSYAAFGQLTYPFSEQLSVTAGLRYSNDDKEARQAGINNNPAGDPSGGLPLFPGAPYDISADDSWSATTGKLGVEFRTTDAQLLYASISKGFKSGIFPSQNNVVQNVGVATPPEEVWSYELGAKTQWLDDTLRANVALFYMDYTDLQLFRLNGLVLQTFTEDTRNQGAELEVLAAPIEGLELGLNAAYLKAEVDGGVNDGGQLPRAPENTLGGFAQYAWPVAGGGLSVRADFKWTDDYRTEIPYNTGNAAADQASWRVTEVESFALLDARATYSFEERNLEFAVWGKNLTDETYPTHIIPFLGNGFSIFGAPRTYGVSVSWKSR